MIEIKHLRKEYSNATPLKDINCVINDGDVVTLIGPSGTGKSTLLRCINRLETPTSGDILVDGISVMDKKTDLTEVRKKVGMVFQGFNLYNHLTVLENVMIPQMDLLKRTKQEAYDKAIELLKSVGLFEKRFNFPETLSGGQKQRVAIARTLAMDTNTILLDEPTSALDPTMVGEVEAVIRQLSKMGKTMLIVTHEMRFAQSISNRIIFLNDGYICEDNTPDEIFNNPQQEPTKQFVYRIKSEEFDITSKHFDYPECISRLIEFANRNQIDKKQAIKLNSVFEELIAEKLKDRLDNKVNILVSYSEVKETVKLIVKYNGEEIDFEDENDISNKLISHYASRISHTECDSKDYERQLDIKIQK